MTRPGSSSHLSREAFFLFAAALILSTALSVIGFQNLSTWRFDAAIIASFLFGDYVLRWLLGRRDAKTTRRTSVPEVLRPAFRFAWFFVIILLAGELVWLATFFAGIFYSGSLPSFTIVFLSFAIGIGLALDYMTNYQKQP
jgi:hypothetical protein